MACLDFNQHVLQQILVILIQLDIPAPHQLFQGGFVRLQGGGKIHQGLLYVQKLNQLFVLHGFAQLLFQGTGQLVDLLEELEEPGGDPQHQVQHKLRAQLRSAPP